MKDKLSEALSVPVPKKRAGARCTCGAYWQGECGCSGVDWTDPELVDLRSEVAGLKRDMESLQEDIVALGDENDDLLAEIDRRDKLEGLSEWWGQVHINGSFTVNRYYNDGDLYKARENGSAKAIYGPFRALHEPMALVIIQEMYQRDNSINN